MWGPTAKAEKRETELPRILPSVQYVRPDIETHRGGQSVPEDDQMRVRGEVVSENENPMAEKPMTTVKRDIVEISTGDQAFERIEPILDRLVNNMKEARRVIGREYAELRDDQKKLFRERITKKYGWSDDRILKFARIEKRLPNKLRIINSTGARTTPLDELSTRTLTAICDTPDKDLKLGAKAGLFENAVTSEDIKRFRNTGAIPRKPVIEKPKTDLQKIRGFMEGARKDMDHASLKIGSITNLMQSSNITDAKGKEATALIQAFERLCTKMATANPVTSKRAFAILRGEV